jgi:acetate kinase
MEWCGMQLDDERNNKAVGLQPGHGAKITREGSSLNAFVVAADEETWIARETVQCLEELRVS